MFFKLIKVNLLVSELYKKGFFQENVFSALSYDNSLTLGNNTRLIRYRKKKIRFKKKIRSEESCEKCSLLQDRWTVKRNAAMF